MRKWLSGLMLAQLLLCLPALGIGFVVVERHIPSHPPFPPHPPLPPEPPSRPWWPHWRPEPYVFAPLEVASIDVRSRVEDQVAVTTIEQEFYNPNSSRLEGTFVCPLPKGAQINKFTLEIDGKPSEAELVQAEKARRIYEDIVRSMKDPALLEYAGRDAVKVRIFPFEPRSKRKITLKYTELLKKDAGMVAYNLPLSAEKFSSKPVSNVSVTVELKSSRPLKSIYSPSHDIDIKRSGAKSAVASLESSEKALPTDFSLYFAPDDEELGMNLLTFRERGQDGYFVFMASPGLRSEKTEIVAKDVTFVLDTSGSMAGKKLEQAKKALEFCIENLNEEDRFEIIRFSTEVEALFDKLVPANTENRKKASRFAADLKPMGGTAIADALQKSLSLHKGNRSDDRPRMIIFLTDGRPTVGETGEEEIVSKVKADNGFRQRIFCFGIGHDVNTHLLDKITEQTRGFSQYVLPEEDLEVKVSRFFSKIKEPLLANVSLEVTGGVRAVQLYPSDLPDVFNGDQLVVVGRYKSAGSAALKIAGTVNGTAREFTYEGDFSDSSSQHDFLPRLWATRRIGWLLDEIRLRGENQELKDEVTDLARRYSIVTPYTSYLIVEDEDRRRVPREFQSLQRMQSDDEARRAGRDLWGSYQNSKDGVGATSAARENYAYKSANAPAAAAIGGAMESSRALGVPYSSTTTMPPAARDEGKVRLAQYSQQAQFVAGKTFFNNNNQWVDSAVQKQPNARLVNVKFGSEEYFELGRKHPIALQYLALGRNVQFALGDAIYTIQE